MSDSTLDRTVRWPRFVGALAVIAAIAALAVGAFGVQRRIDALSADVRQLRAETVSATDALKLLRLEAASKGRGIGAVLEQIGYWAPMLQSSATPGPYVPYVRERLDEALDAIRTIGADAYSPVLGRLRDATDDEERKWLLRGLLRIDATRGTELLTQVARSTRLKPSARLRFFAADELLRRDKQLAGQVLKDILEIESARGIQRQVPPQLQKEYKTFIGTNQFPMFFNFIDKFVASEHPDVVAILTMLIGRKEHDPMTYQKCIQHLGKLKAKSAVRRIEALFDSLPGRVLNPIFQNACLQALAEIQGGEACKFFQRALSKTTNETVVMKLQALVKEYCQ